ncbi:MAG: hypothetical protein CMM02_05110 [Rhodopirellula sp.]|nr:hypothetical protein [Rhodopirellula sp.]|tara:strand:+ start:529 stop:1605 length:1077 start_codon:yes stop_codon:yes gene_type:complete
MIRELIKFEHFWPISITCFGTLFILFFCYNFAQSINLVDHPDWRKDHEGRVPLIGGIAIVFGFSLGCLISPRGMTEWRPLFVCMIPLLVIGIMDDHGDLSVIKRISAQLLGCIAMVYYGDIYLNNLGDIFGTGNILKLNIFELIFTIFCVIGVVNSLNLIDGSDGLCAVVSLVACIGIISVVKLKGADASIALILYFAFALLSFVIVNLGLTGGFIKKVFLGDAGSTIIGFFLCWYFIRLSQSESNIIKPINTIWLLALPIMDTLSVMIRRIRNNRSPFNAGRDHIHHLLLEMGYSSKLVLLILSIFSITMAVFGVISEVNNFQECYSFYSILLLFVVYHLLSEKLYRLITNRKKPSS